jgi:hypothetical protein
MLSTKNLQTGGGGVSKTINPGNVTAKILKITLDEFKFKPGAYHLVLHLEGEPMGDDFEGFMIDKDNPDAGRHKGQVGRVRASEWAYADGETKSGIPVSRDTEILKTIKNLCDALGCGAWFHSQDDKHATIEDFVTKMNEDAPYKNVFLDWCVAGKEYQSKQGYTNYDLFLPKFNKGSVPYELSEKNSGKLIMFDASVHLKRVESKPVENFGDDQAPSAPSKTTSSDFDL